MLPIFAVGVAATLFTAASATPISSSNTIASRASTTTKYGNTVYWGQNDSEKSLADYCAAEQGIDTLVIAFLYNFGLDNTQAGVEGNFGDECYVAPDGTGQGCEKLAADIDSCRSLGKRIILSLGGYSGNQSLTSEHDADTVGNLLWNSWAHPSAVDASAPRPIGDTYVDGWDIDVEHSNGTTPQLLPRLINTLRGNFDRDTERKYLITGAPECVIPDEHQGISIQQSQYDILWVQFYNNDCAAWQYTHGDPSQFNYDAWIDYVKQGASKDAELYIGIPAGLLGANDNATDSGHQYVPPKELVKLYEDFHEKEKFSGFMMWDAGNSDTVDDNGCNYAQSTRKILDTGATC